MQVNEKDVEDEWLMIDVEEEETKQSVKDSNDYNTNNRKVPPGSPFAKGKYKKIPRKSLKAKGNDAFRSLKFKKAIELYSLALETGEDDGKGIHILYSNRSNAYYKAKMYEFALQDAKKSVELSPTFAKGFHRIAVAQIALEKKDEAKEAYKAAIKIEPDNQAYKQLLSDLE